MVVLYKIKESWLGYIWICVAIEKITLVFGSLLSFIVWLLKDLKLLAKALVYLLYLANMDDLLLWPKLFDEVQKEVLFAQNFDPRSLCLLYTSDAADE